MDNPDAALPCQRHRQSRFADRIHSRREQRDVQLYFSGQARLHLCFSRQDLAVSWNDQYIIESEGFRRLEKFFINIHNSPGETLALPERFYIKN